MSTLTHGTLSLETLNSIIVEHHPIAIDGETMDAVSRSYEFLKAFSPPGRNL